MKEHFLERILKKHQAVEAVPPNERIADWALALIDVLFPERLPCKPCDLGVIQNTFEQLERDLISMLNATKACNDCNNETTARLFFDLLPELFDVMNTDVSALLLGDPAAKSAFEIIRTYPGFLAIALYRIAHALSKLDVPLIPRILTEYGHSRTGIDIHPGARIGTYFFIDHGTGIVIGETTQVGNHVKLYQGVTLGALSVDKSMADVKRHPTIEDDVIIYAGATILGGDTTIGSHSIIGGNVWLTQSIPAYSRVYHQATIKVVNSNAISS